MDNAPGHFDGFERGNVKVEFFPPNCTSWKQPCDMGIIAALKKRYKYLYLKDVLDFCDLDESVRIHKTEQGKRIPRGAAGVAYGKPAHLLDATKASMGIHIRHINKKLLQQGPTANSNGRRS